MSQTINRSFRVRFLIVTLGLCFLFILVSSLAQRFMHPDLTVHNFDSSSQGTASEAQMQNMAEIGQLMETAAKNPQDGNVLLRLVESLMAVGQWQSAENFAQKALTLQGQPEQNEKALYLLALIHHNQGRNAQAAELLEKLLEKSENPSARYSLGIIYIHFLNNAQAGIAQLQKGLLVPALPAGLRAAMQEELDKAARNEGNHAPKEDASPSDSRQTEIGK